MRTTTRRVVSSLFALMLFSTAGLSQVLKPPRVARSVATAPVAADEQAARGEPIELSLREDLRERCSEFALPPEPYVIESAAGSEAQGDALALEGLAVCLMQGPLAGSALELIGPAEFADAARLVLGRLSVPFDRMVTRDVPLDPMVSPHAAPRVVLAPGEG